MVSSVLSEQRTEPAMAPVALIALRITAESGRATVSCRALEVGAAPGLQRDGQASTHCAEDQ